MSLTILFLPERSVSIKDMIINMTMLQTLFGIPNVDGAYWTLFCELFFYTIVFLLILLKQNKKEKIVIYIYIWLALQLALLFMPDKSFFIIVNKINTLLYMHCFMAGLIIAIIEKNIQEKVKYNQNIGVVVCLLFFIAQQFIQHECSSGIFFALAVIILGVAVIANNIITIPMKIQKFLYPLTIVSMISYPLYLLHQNIGYIIIRYLERAGIFNEILLLIIPFLCIIFLASIIHYCIEKPAENYGHKLIERYILEGKKAEKI